ncbi:MAG: peptidase, partial [Prevotella sp.]|nr:peptidase [Prevotella sp.]
VALWLQACPTLSPAQVMDVIANTAVRKHTDMEYPNNLYGYGEIDAAAGLKYIERVYTGIQNVYDDNDNDNDGGKAIYDLCGRRLNSMPAKGIFIVGGKKVVR